MPSFPEGDEPAAQGGPIPSGPPLGEDLFPALETLSKYIKQHVRLPILIAAGLALTTPALLLFPDQTLTTVQAVGLLLALYALHNGGYFKLPSSKIKLDDSHASIFLLGIVLVVFTTTSRPFEDWIKILPVQEIRFLFVFSIIYHLGRLWKPELDSNVIWIVVGFALMFFSRPVVQEWTSLPFLQPWANDLSVVKIVLMFALYVLFKNSGGQLPEWVRNPNLNISGDGVTATSPSNGTKDDGGESMISPSEAISGFKKVWKLVGPYIKVAILLALACYLPMYHGLPLYFQTWVHFLIAATVAVVGYFSPTEKFYGPLRFGYLEYRRHFEQIGGWLVDWWVYVVFFMLFPALLPFLGISVLAVCLAAWLLVHREYIARLADVKEKAADACSRASVAEASAREYASAAREYGRQVLDLAVAARRDSVLASSVRVTDFFNCTAGAWAHVSSVKDPIERLIKAAERAAADGVDIEEGCDLVPERFDPEDFGDEEDDDDGNDDEESEQEDPNEALGRDVREAAASAKKQAKIAKAKLEAAQESIKFCQKAEAQNRNARTAVSSYADRAVAAASEVEKLLAGSAAEAFTASATATKVKNLVDKAIAAAALGDMTAATLLLTNSIEKSAAAVIESKDSLHTTMERCRNILLLTIS